ncbi:MAG: PIN domain-containing protein [Verrucomicrobiota bacterium JB022]|nr:PIN domain-containing protein [Verrucomicrobiota bacterium JB022]
MTSGQIIVDEGPLVAFLYRRDHHHAWVRRQAQHLPTPWITCGPVLTEAAHLLGQLPGGVEALFKLLERGLLVVDFDLMREREAITQLMRKYASQPMSLGDACLVRMSELFPEARVLTFDHDFTVYKRLGRRVIPIVAPF